MVKTFGLILSIFVISLAAYMLIWQMNNPIVVLEFGQVSVKSHYDPYKIHRAKTRKVRRGGIEFWEVEIIKKGWMACGITCEETYRTEITDFWKHQTEEGS